MEKNYILTDGNKFFNASGSMLYVPVYSVVDYDGNVYTEITIGSQTWLKENLKTTHFNNGASILQLHVDTSLGTNYFDTPVYGYPNDSSVNKAVYGNLYTWPITQDIRGITPSGYRIPTSSDFNTLVTYLGGSGVAGGHLKEAGLSHWTTPNTGADNTSGFTALPAGWLSTAPGLFLTYGLFWTSTSYDSLNAYRMYVEYNSAVATVNAGGKGVFQSIRCIKN